MKKSALYKHRPKFKKRDSSTPVYGRTSQYSTTFKKRINQSLADFKPVEPTKENYQKLRSEIETLREEKFRKYE